MSSSKKLTPVKCGLKFKPPMLVLLYNDSDTGKARKRSMPLRGFTSDTNVATYLADLLQSPKHSRYLSTIPQQQLDSLLQRVKDAHRGVTSPPSITITTPKPLSHLQSSLLDIPPIHTSSPNHTQLNKKGFDSDVDNLINFDDDSKEGKKVSLSSDSLERLLESPENGGSEQKEATVSRQLFSKENGEQGSTKLSNLPGLSSLGISPKLNGAAEDSQDDDPLLSVLNGSAKRPFGVPPLNSTRDSGLGKLPPIGSAPIQTGGSKKKGGDVKNNKSASVQAKADNLQLLEHKPDNKRQSSNTFATEVPDYSDSFDSESSLHRAQGNNGGREDMDDESLAVEELLDDGDDDSLGLGLGEKVYTGMQLSGSSSGDDLRRLNEIVTPPPMLDEGARVPLVQGSQGTKTTASKNPLFSPLQLSDEDLNKATDEYLAEKKEEMDLLFESNRLKPGDDGYVYDKAVDFGVGEKMESGWDSDGTMSDF